MTTKNKIIVKILGQDYTIVSDDEREYVQKVSNIVDDKMQEIKVGNKKLSISMVAVLTALNLADDYVKSNQKHEELLLKMDNPLFIASEKKEKYDELKERIKTLNQEVISKTNLALQLEKEKNEFAERLALKERELHEFIETFDK
jgi:cell division protein ZapA